MTKTIIRSDIEYFEAYDSLNCAQSPHRLLNSANHCNYIQGVVNPEDFDSSCPIIKASTMVDT